jgi:ketosteroid isomerase-like protein
MTARETIESYFGELRARGTWQDWLAGEIAFTSLTAPNKVVRGKPAVTQVLTRFYSTMAELAVNSLVVEGERAIALTHYRLRPANGAPDFESDVAEAFVVRDGRIADLKICFDTAPYPK